MDDFWPGLTPTHTGLECGFPVHHGPAAWMKVSGQMEEEGNLALPEGQGWGRKYETPTRPDDKDPRIS